MPDEVLRVQGESTNFFLDNRGNGEEYLHNIKTEEKLEIPEGTKVVEFFTEKGVDAIITVEALYDGVNEARIDGKDIYVEPDTFTVLDGQGSSGNIEIKGTISDFNIEITNDNLFVQLTNKENPEYRILMYNNDGIKEINFDDKITDYGEYTTLSLGRTSFEDLKDTAYMQAKKDYDATELDQIGKLDIKELGSKLSINPNQIKTENQTLVEDIIAKYSAVLEAFDGELPRRTRKDLEDKLQDIGGNAGLNVNIEKEGIIIQGKQIADMALRNEQIMQENEKPEVNESLQR